MTAQYFGHLGLVLSAITPPLALMLVDEIVVRQRRRPLTLGLLAAGLTVAAVLHHPGGAAHRGDRRCGADRRAGDLVPRPGASARGIRGAHARIAAVAAVVVLAYPTWLQFLAPGHLVIHGAVHGTDIYVTDAANFVVPTVAQLISPQSAIRISSHFSGNASEWDGYLGIPLVLILVVATVRFWRVPVIRTAGIVAAIVAILSLGPHLHLAGHQLPLPLPWWIPAHLPVLENILPARMMIYVYLAASITFAFLLRALWLIRSSFAVNARRGPGGPPATRADPAGSGDNAANPGTLHLRNRGADVCRCERALRTLPGRRLSAGDDLAAKRELQLHDARGLRDRPIRAGGPGLAAEDPRPRGSVGRDDAVVMPSNWRWRRRCALSGSTPLSSTPRSCLRERVRCSRRCSAHRRSRRTASSSGGSHFTRLPAPTPIGDNRRPVRRFTPILCR